jgi:arginyl-tRNA synthetase
MSGSVLGELAAPLEAAVVAAGGNGEPVRLERPADPAHGDYASAVALSLARPLKAPPREIAERIAAGIDSPWIGGVEIAGPGFINLRLQPAWFQHVVARVLEEGDRFGAGAAARPQRLQVEFVSGNPTGPVTVGSARNAAYGDSLARLFSFAGHDVETEYYFNDAGRQIDLFGESLRARARGEEVPEEGYQGEYIVELAKELGLGPDAPLEEWSRRGTDQMMAQIRTTLDRFRVHFDSWFRERALYEDGSVERAIERVREAGHTFEQDGALWLRSTAFGDDKDRVIVRSNGQPGYLAGDIAYIVSKLERGFDVAVYVLGADHHGYRMRLKAAAAALGYDPDRIDVQLYQLVHLTGGRMSKRAGRVVTLDDLIDAIGVDASRFMLVQRSHDQTIELDLDLLVQQNPENPVYYCQYAHARIAQILRKAGDAADGAVPAPTWEPQPAEAALVKSLAGFPDLVAEAADRRGPHRVVAFAQETAKEFHQFYDQCRVIGEAPDVQSSRLALCEATRRVMQTALGLVGVEAPDQM